MNPDPFFSVIIPTYNRADFIGKTIQSLLEQTYQNFEIIVINDGGTDNTNKIIKDINDDRIQYYYKENAERGAARNYGAKKAKGQYLNFFDSDDIAYPDHLEEAKKLVDEYQPKILTLNYEYKSEDNKNQVPTKIFTNVNQQLTQGNILSCNGVFIKKEIALQYPFSENRKLSGSEDYLLWLRLAARFTYYYSNQKTSWLVMHDQRSVVNINPQSIIQRKELMLEGLYNDETTKRFFGHKIKNIVASTFAYLALHLAMAKSKKLAIKYYFKAIAKRPAFIFSKRSMAIIKRLIVS